MSGKMLDSNIEILDYSLGLINSLPYKVSLRFIFYDLLQNGFYSEKDDYIPFKSLMSRARKGFKRGWNPDSLTDDTRAVYYHGEGYINEQTSWKGNGENLDARLAHFQDQDNYIELWFESRNMYQQFAYYSHGCTMRPFGGDYTIPMKWQAAGDLDRLDALYNKPITILYFGDLDEKGQEIPYNTIRDVSKWCDIDFDFEVCGLTKEQQKRYKVPENISRKGYQWAGLKDKQAGEIITTAIKKYINLDIIEQREKESEALTQKMKAKLLR